jgi:hypothetical protein
VAAAVLAACYHLIPIEGRSTMARKIENPFVFYADGSPVYPGDVVLWRDKSWEVLALYINRVDGTNVSLWGEAPQTARAKAEELTLVSSPIRMFKVEVIADSSGVWASNALTFATRDEANEYAIDLASRWTLVREWRVVPVDVV